MREETITAAVRECVAVPPHIDACASAVRYDLLHGPAWAAVPPAGIEAFTADHFATFREELDELETEGCAISEVYAGPVAQALRDFINDLPTLYVDEDGFASEDEPQAYCENSWHAGWNMPGYMPDNEPAGFSSWEEALEYLVEEIEREASNQPDEDCAGALDALKAARPGRAVTVYAAGYAWWIEPTDASEESWIEPAPYYEVSGADLVSALFGPTIAREFR